LGTILLCGEVGRTLGDTAFLNTARAPGLEAAPRFLGETVIEIFGSGGRRGWAECAMLLP
jgi:hypothetical protein